MEQYKVHKFDGSELSVYAASFAWSDLFVTFSDEKGYVSDMFATKTVESVRRVKK